MQQRSTRVRTGVRTCERARESGGFEFVHGEGVTIRELHVLLTSELCVFEAEGGLSWHALHLGVPARSRCTGVWSAWPLGYEKRRAFSHLPHGVALRAAMASATFSDMNAAVMFGDILSDDGAHRCKYLDVVAGCRLCQWLGSEAVVIDRD